MHFEHCMDRAGPILLRICTRLARDRELAHEALQEAMVRIWQKSHLYDPAKGTAIGWMVAVTRNCTFNMIDQREHMPLDDELLRTFEQPGVRDIDIATDISRCLAALSENYRESIVMIYHFGLSYEELATRMSVPVNTVKTWIHRSVEQLRLCLDNETG
jgi:RNA polymerase sigma-70 factor (ECF subfamily)